MPRKNQTVTLIKYAAVPGGVVAFLTLWGMLGFPTLATGSDIRRLDRGQAETAIEVYQTKMRSLLVIAPQEGTPAYRAWQEELDRTRQQANRAEQRRIELSK